MRLAQDETKQRLKKAIELIRAAKNCGDRMDPASELDCAIDQIQLVVDSMSVEAMDEHAQE